MGRTKQIIVTTSWDDGHPLDMKLADLLKAYDINGTFYVPLSNSKRKLIDSAALIELAGQFEIGGHTRDHVDLTRLKDDTLENQIGVAKTELEDIIDKKVKMFCYPKGKYAKHVSKAVAHAGFIGARTTREFFIECGKDVYMMPTTLHAYPHSPLIRLRHAAMEQNWRGFSRFLRMGIKTSWADIALYTFEKTLENGGVWHLWGHSWEIEEYDLWDGLRKVFDVIAHQKEVRYLTNAQVIEQVV